jgi:pimeloyl-ACP methyl ester carboxylesterase
VSDAFELDLPSGRVHVERSGSEDAPVVICIHGLSANARGFDAIVPWLAEQQLQAIAVDLRGRGRSQLSPPGTYGLDAHAQDMLAVADALGADSMCVIGWSLGALIAITMAEIAPSRLRRVVLIDHAAAVDDGPANAIRAGLARLDAVVEDPQTYVEAIRSRLPIRRWNDFWDRYFSYELARRPDGRWSASTDRAACEEDMLNLRSPDLLRARWSALRMPTLLIRCTVPLAGGLIVPQTELDALLAAAPDVRVLELDVNHYEVVTDDRAARAIVDHLTA